MLLQEIRAKQAMKELNYNADIKINHQEPTTTIGDREYTLVFPKKMFEYSEGINKEVDLLFIGNMTASRKLFLSKFPNAKIIASRRGRDPKIKEYDDWYFNEMSKAKFVLCPDGDFVWTYRFFESIIFKAIPVIEHTCKHYLPYKYYKQGDTLKYCSDIVESNFNILKQNMTL